jgi:hypothetical protein
MRVAVLSPQGIHVPFYWRNLGPPLEQALASQPGATLVAPAPFRKAMLRPNRPAWLAAIRTLRRAEAVFWIQEHLHPATPLWALAYLSPLARRGILAADAWEPTLGYLARIVEAQRPFVCWVFYSQALERLRLAAPAVRWEWLGLGVDLTRFHDLGRDRDLYAFWMGRRYEPLHEALAAHCAARGLAYRFSTGPTDPGDVTELNELISRARYFVVTPPNLQNPDRTGSFSPLTSRYLEGTAAGARLLGVPPVRRELEALLPAGALVECASDGRDLGAVLDAADADPAFDELRVRTRDEVVARHGWEERARAIHASLTEAA